MVKTIADFQPDDPTELLYELLDKLVALGDVAWQLNHALGSNGHRPKDVAKLIQELKKGK